MASFEEAARDFYLTAEKWGRFGASDTEPRAEFAEVIAQLADGRDPGIPTTVRGWSLYSGMKGNGLAAAALTRATRRAVEAGKTDAIGLIRYARAQGWAW